MDLVYLLSQVKHLSKLGEHSFSAAGEDVLMRLYLPENRGKYLDIGAGHPTHGSNSFFFYKLGWHGICVEPVKAMVFLRDLVRRRDLNMRAVISNENGEIVFYQFNPTEYSTISESRYQEMLKLGMRERKTYKIHAVKLEEIIDNVTPAEPYFLSVDVEGYDLEILKQLVNLKSRPRVVCVEETGSNKESIKSLLESLGYIVKHTIGNNGIYVHRVYLQIM